MYLGTANMLMYMRGKGIVLDETSMVAIRQDCSGGTSTIEAGGIESKRMLEHTRENIIAIHRLKDGMISDLTTTKKIFSTYSVRRIKASCVKTPVNWRSCRLTQRRRSTAQCTKSQWRERRAL
jgi:rod shape-determining protein MreB